ncbi:OprO/OprP family phosphate-selective porin [Planctomicrobium sp. SH668]|uniref:OprO/OprP family phosphate-selective porin n=1 Tax=Planctomicrobium sp. SH668 TaxID=3448126 RepID=UPI003F5B7E00
MNWKILCLASLVVSFSISLTFAQEIAPPLNPPLVPPPGVNVGEAGKEPSQPLNVVTEEVFSDPAFVSPDDLSGQDPVGQGDAPPAIGHSIPAMVAAVTGGASALRYPTIALTGFAQIDAIWFDQSEQSILNNDDIQDYAGFRRARLAGRGMIAENTGYMLEMDFAFLGRPSFMDVFVEQQQVPVLGNIRIGQFRQPLMMDAMNSVRDLVFLERPSIFAFIPFRQIGVMAFNTAMEESMTWAASVYRFPTDMYGNAYSDNGYGTSYRVTVNPINDESSNENLHLGAGYSYNTFGRFGNGAHFFGFRALPEIGINMGEVGDGAINTPVMSSTGTVTTAKASNIFSLEAAYSHESFLVQSEFMDVIVQDPVMGNQNYHGAYAQASYVLTGERHKYDKRSGTFGRVVPKSNLGATGWGAWEIAGRWSYINLKDTPNDFVAGQPPNGVSPTLMTNLTAGLNWYWNAYAKMQFNYIHVHQDVRGAPNANTGIFALRTQFDF